MENNELAHNAPKLARLKKEELGFAVPNDYFEHLQEALELRVWGGDSVPEGYFDQLEDKVFDRLNNESKVLPIQRRIIQKVLPYLAAASIALFILIKTTHNTSENAFEGIELAEIEAWIDYGEIELDTYEIASVYSDEDFESLSLNGYSDSDLIDYLDDIDLESLLLNN